MLAILSEGRELEIAGITLNILLLLFLMYVLVALVDYIFYKRTRIKLLEASAWHYITDPLLTIVIVVMISVVVSMGGLYIVDPIIALVMCFVIGYGDFKRSLENLSS
ncbi:MAG: cation transporter [Candidatus Njordarchaeales archaeon]